MNKKILTLAIAGALVPFALPVTATAGVTISGYANASVDSLDSGTVSNGNSYSGSYISSNASNLVISGDTDLGGGLKALFSAQTFLSFGSDNAPAGFSYDQFSNGNTYAGLEGGFGTIAAGRNDSPMKQLGRAVDLFGNEIGDSRNIISADPGVKLKTTSGGTAAASYGFDERPGHTLFYVSPDLGGVTVKAAYTLENSALDNPSGGTVGSGTPSAPTTAPPTYKGSESSVSAVYSQGILLGGLAYEYHSAAVYGASNAETALRAAGAIDFDPVRVTALYQHDSDLSGVSSASRNVWGLGVAYTFIPDYAVKAQYYDAANVGGTSDTAAHMVAVGLTHTFSKNASAYLDYVKTTNDANAGYNAFAGGHGNTVLTPAPSVDGSDPHGVSLGMIYTF